MANCKEWLALSPEERIRMTGKAVIGMQNDTYTFNLFKSGIELADLKGVYLDTKIDSSNPAALSDLDNPIENFTN